MRSTLKFFSQFISEPANIGAVAPSSRTLARVVTEAAGVRDASYVVEYGPGTGVITSVIQEHLPKNARFFAMEITPHFIEVMHRNHPDVRVVEDSAQNIVKHLKKDGVQTCDAIISGLPFTAFDDALQLSLIEETHRALRPGGMFVNFTYIQSPFFPKGRQFRRLLKENFSEVTVTPIVWKNIPPAFAYCARK